MLLLAGITDVFSAGVIAVVSIVMALVVLGLSAIGLIWLFRGG